MERHEPGYSDCWPNGQAIDLVVFYGPVSSGVGASQQFVSYTTSDGDRLFTTLSDYNKHFPDLWLKESERWREGHARCKREKMGL